MQCNLNGFTPNLTGIYLNGFTPNLTSQIRPASKAFNRQCNLNGFTPNSTGQIRQALITGQIG